MPESGQLDKVYTVWKLFLESASVADWGGAIIQTLYDEYRAGAAVGPLVYSRRSSVNP